MHPSLISGLCLIAGLTLCVPTYADPTVGVRAGGGEGLRLYSLFGRWRSPWLQENLVAPYFSNRVQAYWDLSVERWDGEDINGDANSTEVFIAGPVIRVNWPSRRLFILLGVQPSYMTHRHIDDDDMGGNIQFTSHAELGWTVAERITLGQ